MEQYPQDYVAHNLPLLVLAGVPQDLLPVNTSKTLSAFGNGLSLTSDLPDLSGPDIEQLVHEFAKTDGAAHAWSEHSQAQRDGLVGFKIATSGRSFTFPSRKAVPPPMSPDRQNALPPSSSLPIAPELHSPLSPLSPTSPIFPDGLLSPLWLAKHQTCIPSVILSFYRITSDHSQSTLQDNRIKSDINLTKDALLRSGHKSRFSAVIIADRTLADAPELEDRIAGIRRATALDQKTGLFFLPSTTAKDQLSAFVLSVVTALQPVCIDYYRDLTKHARRKKGRGYLPTPSMSARGTSQNLTTNGWNVRYDFKLAVFAEFRQEMDAAQRHYESALEELFGPEGRLETTASWSPRWNDHRLLCDIIAFRILRCQLWRGMTSSASESWCNYKYRTKDLIDRRGKGTGGYGWAAWEARWAKMMAQLVEMADLPIFKQIDLSDSRDDARVSMVATYAPPEKAYSAMDRMPPFHCLHHPGYWWNLVSKHVLSRRRKAEAVSSEDRTPPDQLSAAEAATRARSYDTYLVPPPHEEAPTTGHATYDYMLDLHSQADRAESEFTARGQYRAVQLVRLDYARELVRAERYDEALSMLRPVWNEMTWRREGWYDSIGDVLQLLHRCASQLGDHKLMFESSWEMACQELRSQDPIDLMSALDMVGRADKDSLISMSSRTRLTPVDLRFAFKSNEGFVGDHVAAQIVLELNASEHVKTITIDEIRINFGSNFRSLNVAHVADSADHTFSYLQNPREDHDASHPMAKTLHYEADLQLKARQTKVYDVLMPLREADSLYVTGATIILRQAGVVFEYVYAHPADLRTGQWLLKSAEATIANRICRAEPSTMTVLPKPPKMRINILEFKEQYFTNEKVVLEVEITNEEDEETDVLVEAHADDEAASPVSISWSADGDQYSTTGSLAKLEIGSLAPATSSRHRIVFHAPAEPSTYSLTVTTKYRLQSSPDAETPLSKSLTVDMAFASPFEANYDFGPRLHPEKYPNFFELPDAKGAIPDAERKPEGVEQRWCLTSRLASFVSSTLIIESTSVVVNKVTGNAICIPQDKPDEAPMQIMARGMESVSHILNTRKYSLEDRRISALDLSLSIKWRRADTSEGQTTTTLLAIPHLAIPHAEPRVLCTVESPLASDAEQRTIKYTLENPSMHFLTFTLTMEASDEFALSGPKYRSISLTPMSRAEVLYDILVYERENDAQVVTVNGQRGRWISPALKVMDPYYNRSLKIMDAGEGVRSDERGNVAIWIAVG